MWEIHLLKEKYTIFNLKFWILIAIWETTVRNFKGSELEVTDSKVKMKSRELALTAFVFCGRLCCRTVCLIYDQHRCRFNNWRNVADAASMIANGISQVLLSCIFAVSKKCLMEKKSSTWWWCGNGCTEDTLGLPPFLRIKNIIMRKRELMNFCYFNICW